MNGGDLWVCHAHERIGAAAEAAAHVAEHGCQAERLDAATEAAVCAEWSAQRARRIAGFMALAATSAPRVRPTTESGGAA